MGSRSRDRLARCRQLRALFLGMASRKAQAELPDSTRVAGDEITHMFGDRDAVDVAAGLYLVSDLSGDVLRPMLQRVECYDPDRVVKLPRHEIGDDCFELCPLD